MTSSAFVYVAFSPTELFNMSCNCTFLELVDCAGQLLCWRFWCPVLQHSVRQSRLYADLPMDMVISKHSGIQQKISLLSAIPFPSVVMRALAFSWSCRLCTSLLLQPHTRSYTFCAGMSHGVTMFLKARGTAGATYAMREYFQKKFCELAAMMWIWLTHVNTKIMTSSYAALWDTSSW